MWSSLESLIDDRGFHNGLRLGVAALVVLTVVALLRDAIGRRTRPPLRLAGIAAVVAILLAFDRTGAQVLLSDGVTRGVLLLAVPPLAVTLVLGPRRWWVRILAAVVAVPGAVVLADASRAHNQWDWVPAFVLLTAVVGGALATDCDEDNARSGLVPVLLGITAFGVWTTVPDTEQILVVLGVLLPMVLVGWPRARAAHGAALFGVVGLVAWVAVVGGRGRAGAVVGAVACLGLLLVEPIARRILGRRARVPQSPWSARFLALVAVHAVVVGLCARVAGLRAEATSAALIAAVILAGGVAATMLVLAPRPGGSSSERRAPSEPTS